MIYFSFIVLGIYIIFLLIFSVSSQHIPILKLKDKPVYHNSFSIIIPYKNEEKNLPDLLKSIEKLNYPKDNFEIIFVDDKSIDKGTELINKFAHTQIKVIKTHRKSNSPKKDALEKGIKKAKFDFIITTDADCILPENWLQAYNSLILKKDPAMIIAPVMYKDDIVFFKQFQIMEFLALQGITKAVWFLKKPILSNGANLGFHKKAFYQVNAYKGNNHIASGDDIFLLKKFNKLFPDKIQYLNCKSAIVKTKAQENIKELMNQKIRWASKNKKNIFSVSSLVGLFFILTNFLSVLMWILIPYNKKTSIIFILTKIIIDIFFIFQINRFFKNKLINSKVFLSSLLYPFYIFIMFFLSFKGNFIWKDNKYNI